MAGGKITQKTIVNGPQGTGDKNLVVNPNYAYIAPFSFGTGWNEIQLGVFMSFVQTGDGNENSGFDSSSSFVEQLGGTSNDEFFYFGIAKTGETQGLPSGSLNSGFIGMRGDSISFEDSATTTTNRINNVAEANGTDSTASSSRSNSLFFSSVGATMLETGLFNANRGNWLCVGLNSGAAEEGLENFGSDFQPDGCTEHSGRFCAYWGARFKIINKGQSNQLIRFTAQHRDADMKNPITSTSAANVGDLRNDAVVTDVSTGALANLLDGSNVSHFSDPDASNGAGHVVNGHDVTTGFVFNNGGNHVPVPDALFIYNGFNTVRPRIHTWGVKVIS
jgi:hypothetical protein